MRNSHLLHRMTLLALLWFALPGTKAEAKGKSCTQTCRVRATAAQRQCVMSNHARLKRCMAWSQQRHKACLSKDASARTNFCGMQFGRRIALCLKKRGKSQRSRLAYKRCIAHARYRRVECLRSLVGTPNQCAAGARSAAKACRTHSLARLHDCRHAVKQGRKACVRECQ